MTNSIVKELYNIKNLLDTNEKKKDIDHNKRFLEFFITVLGIILALYISGYQLKTELLLDVGMIFILSVFSLSLILWTILMG